MEGRPTKYSKELADQICDRVANSEKGLRAIAKEFNIATSTIMKWLNEESYFSEQYTHAKELQADYMVESMLDIADDTSKDSIFTENGERVNSEWINRSKLRVDTRKWIASKLLPKKYGDKTDITTNGKEINIPIIEWVKSNENSED
jgi:Helix-turn-helix domain of resolvase